MSHRQRHPVSPHRSEHGPGAPHRKLHGRARVDPESLPPHTLWLSLPAVAPASWRREDVVSRSGLARGRPPRTYWTATPLLPVPSCPSPSPRPGPAKVDSPACRPFQGCHPSLVALGGQGGPAAQEQAVPQGSARQDPGDEEARAQAEGPTAAPSTVPVTLTGHSGAGAARPAACS